MKNLSKTVKILGVFIFILVGCAVFVSITNSSKGSELVAIEKEIAMVERDNRELTTKIVKETSLTKLMDRVPEMKMEKPEELVYLTNEKVELSYAKQN